MLAFQDYKGDFTFGNFPKVWSLMTSEDGDLRLAFGNTIRYFLQGLFVAFPLAVITAYFFYKKIYGYKFFRIVFYLPAIISGVVTTRVFSEMISPLGPIAAIAKSMGLDYPRVGFLNQDSTATTTIQIYCLWTCLTSNVLLVGSAMSRIPVELLEAARLDGCKPMRELRSIILPLVMPTLSTILTLSISGFFGASGPILLFKPQGGNNTTTINFWLFQEVWSNGV